MSVWRILLVAGWLCLPVAPANAAPETAGCIVALYPRPVDAAAMAIPAGEPVEQLHLTLVTLGIDAQPNADVELSRRLADFSAATAGPISADVFGHAVINPNSTEFNPSVIYLVGDSPDLVPLRQRVIAISERLFRLPSQHEPWLSHITALYGQPDAVLTYTGTVVFDRVGLKCDENTTYFALGR
jgi:hypothetical protein